MNKTYIISSDNDKLCRNTEERIHPQQVRRFKKNKRVRDESDSEEETLEDTLKIPEQDLDHTLYDDYTWMYCLARKGKVKATEKSLEARAVYQNRRFITVIVRNFYCSAHSIPYPLIMRGDRVGGFEDKVYLYEEKRLRPDFMDPHSDTPCIDLNELKKWGKKGVIFRDRKDLEVEVVPFELRQGGRIKKFAEDKEVDVEDWTDEGFFGVQKSSVVWRHYSSVHEEFITVEVPAVVGRREDVGGDDGEDGNEDMDTSPGSSGVQLNWGDLMADVEYALDVQKRNAVIAPANLKILRMKDENKKFIREERELPHVIDRMSKLQVFMCLSADYHMTYMNEEKDSDGTVIYGVDEDELEENEDREGNELSRGGGSVFSPYEIREIVRRGMADIF